MEGTKRRTQEIGLQKQTRPNGMGRRLQGGDRWATAVRGWLISATTIGTDAGTVLIKYCQYNNRAMNESNRIAQRESSYQGCKGMCKGMCTHQFETQGAGDMQHATTRSAAGNATQRNATPLSHHTIHNTCHPSLVGGWASHARVLRLGGMETTIKSKPQMLEGAAQGGAGGVGRQST